MDEDEELKRRAELAAREARLDEEQKRVLALHCEKLKANDVYSTAAALEAAKIVATEHDLRLKKALHDHVERISQEELRKLQETPLDIYKPPEPVPAAQPAKPAEPPRPFGALTANEVAASANDPVLRQRYNAEEERRTAAKGSASFGQAPAETRSSASFSRPAETQREADEAERRRFEELMRGFQRAGGETLQHQRGGRGGRGR